MAYWLFMFRPDTYNKVKEHKTVGVRKNVHKSFMKLEKGDKFIA